MANGMVIVTNTGFSIPATLTPSGTTQTVDWQSGIFQIISLASASGNVTLTLNNPAQGATYRLKVVQGASSRNLTWPATVKWSGGTAPTISAANGAIDIVYLEWDGTNYFGRFNQAFA